MSAAVLANVLISWDVPELTLQEESSVRSFSVHNHNKTWQNVAEPMTDDCSQMLILKLVYFVLKCE